MNVSSKHGSWRWPVMRQRSSYSVYGSRPDSSPGDLPGRDPYALYDELCRVTGGRHDPCLLDTFIAAVRYMEGGPKKPWWKYTAQRKREMAARSALSQ